MTYCLAWQLLHFTGDLRRRAAASVSSNKNQKTGERYEQDKVTIANATDFGTDYWLCNYRQYR